MHREVEKLKKEQKTMLPESARTQPKRVERNCDDMPSRFRQDCSLS